MDLKVITSSKEEAVVQIDNLTLAELIRVYLNKDSAVTFAAWKREHPTESPILKVQTKGKAAIKALKDASNLAIKDLDKASSDFKKLK